MTWAQVITLGLAIIGAMWALFKWGLDGELKTVRAQLEMILEKLALVDQHQVDIALIKQAMEMHGCLTGDPKCRRKEDR